MECLGCMLPLVLIRPARLNDRSPCKDFPSPKAPQCTTALIPRLQSLWFQKRTIDLCDTPEVTFTYWPSPDYQSGVMKISTTVDECGQLSEASIKSL
jgi:hypothetical protein